MSAGDRHQDLFPGLTMHDDSSATQAQRDRHLAGNGRAAGRTLLRLAVGGPVEGDLTPEQADRARDVAAILGLDEWLRKGSTPPEPEPPATIEHQGRRYGTGRVYGTRI